MCAGITIAIDDRYEVWGSGIISIPWNFRMQDLKPQLLKLLGPAGMQQPVSSSRIVEASFQPHVARQLVSSLRIVGSAMQASRHPRYRLTGLSHSANGVVQQRTGQFELGASGSSASRQSKRYVMHKTSQHSVHNTPLARFSTLAPSFSTCLKLVSRFL